MVRRQGGVSRVELAKHLGLSPSTISAVTSRLLQRGYIREAAVEAVGETEGVRGRPRIGLSLDPQAGHVVGVKISMHQIAVAVVDFACQPIGSMTVPVRSSRQAPEVIADLVQDAIVCAVAQAGLRMEQVDGVGVGVPGFIDGDRGICEWSPVFRDLQVPFAALLGARLDCPVFVENDANLVALAEHWFGDGLGADGLVVVTIEHGVGMGLVTHGHIFRGSHGFASELGHTQVVPDGAPCRCGQNGCVEAYIADYALVRAAAPFIGEALSDDPFELARSVASITERARRGDPELRRIFANAGVMLGRAIANLLKLVDPDRVVLCGGGVRAADLWFEDMRNTVAALTRQSAGRETEFRIDRLGDDVWARGAAAFVLQALYESHAAFRHGGRRSAATAGGGFVHSLK